MSAPLPVFLSVSVALPGVSFDKARRYTLTDGLESLPELMVAFVVGAPGKEIDDVVAIETDSVGVKAKTIRLETEGASNVMEAGKITLSAALVELNP